MAIIQTQARIYRLLDEELIAVGQCALHLFDEPRTGTRSVSGTVVVRWTVRECVLDSEDGAYRLETGDGHWLHVVFTKRVPTTSGPDVLRFRGTGPFRPPSSRLPNEVRR